MTLLAWLGALACAVAAAAAAELMRGNRRLARMRDVAPDPALLSRLSVVVAARDEAVKIEGALRSLLHQKYPDFEVILVDDRSTDATSAIVRRIARDDPRLRIVRIDALPTGWLGKNHALHTGAAAATGDVILFADADIVMEPSVFARTVTYLHARKLDHLTVAPQFDMPGPLLGSFGTFFGASFTLFTRPWRAPDPDRPEHIGIGAFNMLRADSYRAIGGHTRIAFRPDDDLKLGKLVKLHRMRQELMLAGDLVKVEWYSSLRELARGMRKNALAGVDYRAWLLLLGLFAQMLLHVGAPMLTFLAPGAAKIGFAAASLLLLITYADYARFQGSPLWHALLYPLASLLFAAVLLNAAVRSFVSGRIEWRGNYYRLSDLRRARI